MLSMTSTLPKGLFSPSSQKGGNTVININIENSNPCLHEKFNRTTKLNRTESISSAQSGKTSKPAKHHRAGQKTLPNAAVLLLNEIMAREKALKSQKFSPRTVTDRRRKKQQNYTGVSLQDIDVGISSHDDPRMKTQNVSYILKDMKKDLAFEDGVNQIEKTAKEISQKLKLITTESPVEPTLSGARMSDPIPPPIFAHTQKIASPTGRKTNP